MNDHHTITFEGEIRVSTAEINEAGGDFAQAVQNRIGGSGAVVTEVLITSPANQRQPIARYGDLDMSDITPPELPRSMGMPSERRARLYAWSRPFPPLRLLFCPCGCSQWRWWSWFS